MTVEPYRILIIEDDPEHADLIKMGFRRHDEFFLDFAATGEEGLELIAANTYDLISVDLILPGIGGLDVLVRIRKFDPDIPVVMVSGHGTTEMAVVAFENRATKYVVKSLESFKSLPYVFENLIQEARFKIQEREMREMIERSERIHRNIVENALAGIYILQDGCFKLVNPKLGEIFGCTPESLKEMPFWQLVKPDDMECISLLERDNQLSAPIYESMILRKDGTRRWIEFRTVPIEYEGRRAVLGNVLDITQRKELEIEALRSNKELAAINSIMMRALQPEGDRDKALGDALASMTSVLEKADVGGIFLMEGGGLVLRALVGSVEELIEFIEKKESSALLAAPKAHRPDEASRRFWASVPIHCDGRTQGVIVVSSEDSESERVLSFLERAACQVGCLLDIASQTVHSGTSILA
ncbi:MAG: DNA-binding transcriptional activator CusR [Methanosaeta sp. PtaU1.Bin060]|jgi:PAS domain S-box-containing protein|nr:MAG: DNA-binding transcriptional activator CusR [Methanosaeta sp. PtaU1.Bin060]